MGGTSGEIYSATHISEDRINAAVARSSILVGLKPQSLLQRKHRVADHDSVDADVHPDSSHRPNTGKRVEFAKFSSDLPRYSRATRGRQRETIGIDGNKNPGAEEGRASELERVTAPLPLHAYFSKSGPDLSPLRHDQPFNDLLPRIGP
jgi:hypothetical protein